MFKTTKVTSNESLGIIFTRLKLKVGDVFYAKDGGTKTSTAGLNKVLSIAKDFMYSIPLELVPGANGAPVAWPLSQVYGYDYEKFDEESIPVTVYRAIFKNKKGEVTVSQRLFATEDEAKIAFEDTYLQLDSTPVSVAKKHLKKSA